MDKDIQCVDCLQYFIWTAKSQDKAVDLVKQGVFKEVIAPKRCWDCRVKKNPEKYNKQREY